MSSDVSRTRRNVSVPGIILGSFIVVMLASTVLYVAQIKGKVDLPSVLGTKNNGTLLKPPQPIADLPLQTAAGEPFNYAALPKQWSIVIPVARHCDETCQKVLYTTRQLRIALGKHTERVRRIFIATEYPLDADFEKLLTEHPNVQVLVSEKSQFDQFFSKASLDPLRDRQYFIVDPDGWAMMYYNDQIDGKAVMADLKFLLGNSHENEVTN